MNKQQNLRKTSLSLKPKIKSPLNLTESKMKEESMRNLTLYLNSYKRQFQNIKFTKIQTIQAPEEDQILKNSKKVFPEDYDLKCQILVENICENLQIFRKVFKNSPRKRAIMSKLYGWDEQFAQVFFQGQDLKSNIHKQTLFRDFGIDKRTLKGKNTYNKLRLFLQELIAYNLRQQELSCNVLKDRVSESMTKLQGQLDILKNKNTVYSKNYEGIMRKTQQEMMNNKLRIKNKSDYIHTIEQTGSVKINKFFLMQEKNIHMIENLLKVKIN